VYTGNHAFNNRLYIQPTFITVTMSPKMKGQYKNENNVLGLSIRAAKLQRSQEILKKIKPNI